MYTKLEHLLGALGVVLDPDGPTVQIVQLSKAEQATLTKAAGILDNLRENWDQDADDSTFIDIAIASYTMRELVEARGRVELP